MYTYIIDNQAQEQKFSKVLDKIELRITDLNISGSKFKTSISKDVPSLTKDSLRNKTQTLVLIGHEQSFYKMLSTVHKQNADVVLGFIPLEKGFYAQQFGLPLADAACETISKRTLLEIRPIKLGHYIFLFNAAFPRLSDNRGLFGLTRKKNLEKKYAHIQYDDHFTVHGDFTSMQFTNDFSNEKPTASLVAKNGLKKTHGITRARSGAFHVKFEEKVLFLLDNMLEFKTDDLVCVATKRPISCIVGPERASENL